MRILIAVDGSSYSQAALHLGAYIARRAGEPPTLLTVVRSRSDRPPASADAILTPACQILQAEVAEVRTRVRIGHPTQEILREAREGGYDLIVVGERPNHEWLARFLLGSTALRVAARAPCPVVVAKGKAGPIRRILLCDSGAQGPSVLSRFTAQLAEMLGDEEEVTVLHVMSQISAGPGVRGKQLRAQAEELIEEHTPEGEWLQQDVQVLERPGIHPRPKVRHGLVVDEIVQDAQSGNYDLVVIGAHHERGWQRFMLEDLAHKIIVRLDRPVLVVR